MKDCSAKQLCPNGSHMKLHRTDGNGNLGGNSEGGSVGTAVVGESHGASEKEGTGCRGWVGGDLVDGAGEARDGGSSAGEDGAS